jgi:hypothetical protein
MRLRTLALALALSCGVTGMAQAAKKPKVQKSQKFKKTKIKKTKKYKQSNAYKVKPNKAKKATYVHQ